MTKQRAMFKEPMEKTAIVSPCGTYRYELTRSWDSKSPELRWCMLNPSTADGDVDDPTVRKCVGFAQRWGFGSIQIVNLFAFRATNPKDLIHTTDPEGPENTTYLKAALRGPVVVAWGGSIPNSMIAREAVEKVRKLAPYVGTFCLGLTKSHEPRHPLMLAYATKREVWRGNRKT